MAKSQYNLEEIYPNSPLIEVVSEIRFNPELGIQCNIDKFHDRIKIFYPSLAVQQSPILPLPTYLFENNNQQNGIRVALNSFSYFEKKYSGHANFIKKFSEHILNFIRIYKIRDFKRLGWRYVNLVPFTRENGIVPINRFFKIDIKIADKSTDKFENFSTFLMSKVSHGSITTKIETVQTNTDGQEAIKLDFDYAITQSITRNNIHDKITEAHNETRKIFESIITEPYREHLRGKSI